MMAPKLGLAIILLLVMAALPGCFIWDSFWSGCGRVVTGVWDEPGLYDAFPAPGRAGDYYIQWVNTTELGEKYRKASDRNLANDGVLTTKWLRVMESNRTIWSISAPDDLSGAGTRATLDRTFSEISLPPPAEGPDDLEWRNGAC